AGPVAAVDLQLDGGAGVEVPDLRPTVHPVPRRRVPDAEEEVDGRTGVVRPGLPVPATFGVRDEVQRRHHLVGGHRPDPMWPAARCSTAAPVIRSAARSARAWSARSSGYGTVVARTPSRGASRRSSSPSARVFAVTLFSTRSLNRCRW